MTLVMRAGARTLFPDDSPYWIRDEQGNIYVEPAHDIRSGFIDFTHPHIQDRIVQQAIAVDRCGLYDGIMFDYWSEDWTVLGNFRTLDEEQQARDTIVRRIRANTRPNFLIMGNRHLSKIIPEPDGI